MPAPTITPLPTPPSRSQSPETFSTDADAFLGALPDFGSDANAQAAYLDALATAVDLDATTASNAAAVAAGAANYQGDYSAGTTYQIGESVSYNGRRYVAKTVNTGVTPAEGANWFLINDGDVLGPVSATNNGIALYDGTTGKLLKSGLNNGTAGQALISGGAGNPPVWGSVEAGVLPFTASGSITAGNPVCIRSDGAVEVASGYSQSEAIAAAATYTSASDGPRDAFEIPGTSNFVLFYKSGSTQQVVVATISGTSISYNTPVTAPWNGSADPASLSCTYDPISGKFLVSWLQTSGSYADVFCCVMTITGTTPSFGATSMIYNDQYLMCNYVSSCYDSLRQKIIVAMNGINVNSSQRLILLHSINISGTSYSVGYTYGPTSTPGSPSSLNILYDADVQRLVLVMGDATNSIWLFSNSGSAFTYISSSALGFENGERAFAYDSINKRYICSGRDGSNNLVSVTFSVGASTITAGTSLTTTVAGATVSTSNEIWSQYDARGRTFTTAFYANTNQVFYGRLTPSGTTLSANTFIITNSSSRTPLVLYHSGEQKSVIGYYDNNASNGVNRIYTPAATVTNTQDFIGIAAQSASNGQTLNVTIAGGRNTNVTGLTTGANYFLNNNGSLTTAGGVRVGEALSATSILVEGKLAGAGTPSASTFLRGDGAWSTVPSTSNLLASATLTSNASEILVNNLVTTGYSSVIIEFDYLIPSAATSIQFRFVEPGGTVGYGQYYGNKNVGTSSSTGGQSTMNGVASIQLNVETTWESTSDISAQITVFKPSDTTTTKRPFIFRAYGDTSLSIGQHQVGGGYWNQQTFGGFRLFANSGTILAGAKYRVYGVI